MADTFGSVELPVAVDAEPIGDPALAKLGAFLQAVLNAKLSAAWVALRPRTGDAALPVRTVLTRSPKRAFADKVLPALFVYRTRAEFTRDAEDFDQDHGEIRVTWIFPPDPEAKEAPRSQFFNAVAKTVRAAIEAERHPAWVDTIDTDPNDAQYDPDARSIAADPDAILLPKATSTSPVTYSGAGLDGVVGDDTMSPRREIRITTKAATGAYNAAAPIVVTGVNGFGRTRTWNVRLTANGGDDIGLGEEIERGISYAIPAQSSTAGEITIGTSAVNGLGSNLHKRAEFMRCVVRRAEPTQLQVEVLGARDGVRDKLEYEAVEMVLDVVERFVFDPTADPNAGHATDDEPAAGGIDIDYLESDGDGVFESSSLPVD